MKVKVSIINMWCISMSEEVTMQSRKQQEKYHKDAGQYFSAAMKMTQLHLSNNKEDQILSRLSCFEALPKPWKCFQVTENGIGM